MANLEADNPPAATAATAAGTPKSPDPIATNPPTVFGTRPPTILEPLLQSDAPVDK